MKPRSAKNWAVLLAWGLAAPILGTPVCSADGPGLYRDLCAGCHGERGEGAGDFPPLVGAGAADDPEELASFIRLGGGDMPAFPHLSGDEVETLVRFIRASFGEGGAPSDPPAASAPEGDPDRGRAYFTGRLRFTAGGAPCLACHVAGSQGAVSGGSLGSDLTGAGRRYGSAAGLAAALRTAPFPVMRASYAGKPLTDQERADLAAFLQSLEGHATPPAAWVDGFWIPALVGTALLFALVTFVGSRRGPSPARRLRQHGTRGRKS